MLSPQHYNELIASGLNEATIRSAQLYTETDAAAIAKILNWKQTAHRLGPCLVIPFFNLDGQRLDYQRIKPSHPRTHDNGKIIKYESPVGQPNHTYFPAYTRSALRHPLLPVVFTEGEKKSLRADQERIACIGLVGVWGWMVKRDRDPSGRPIGPRQLTAELQSIPWRKRKVAIVFDSDAATNPQVALAQTCLATALSRHHARVHIVQLPPAPNGDKCGLDDFVLYYGIDKLNRLIYGD